MYLVLKYTIVKLEGFSFQTFDAYRNLMFKYLKV